jgi:carboxylate-amine ligase
MDGDALAATFDAVAPLTVGIEEEVMLLDPDTLDLAERAPELLARLAGDGPSPFKRELPASQVELVTPPRRTVPEAVADLADARARLLAAAAGLAHPAAAGYHPFAAAAGELNRGGRYDRAAAEYGWVARRQLVCALHVHVAVGGAERTLAVYNGLRDELPALAALAANAPLRDGADSGLASVRPIVAGQLPRQGVPPPLASWDELAAALRWGAAARTVPEPGFWWWELRPNLRYGTLELRVPDAQTTLADVAAVAAVAHALVAELAERFDAGERAAPTASWKIAENRWSACRHGVAGTLADLASGEPRPTRERLGALLDRLAPAAERVGAGVALADARRLVRRNGALRQREVAAERGARGLAGWLAERFADGVADARDCTSPRRVSSGS